MALFLLLAMIVVPIVEIAVFIELGGYLGLWPTIGTVILTAMVGSALLRLQGLSTLRRVMQSVERGRLPLAEVFDGLCLLVAGALLLTPGFVTDAVGLLLFVPAFRAALGRLLARYLVASGRVTVSAGAAGETIIDGEFQDLTPDNDDTDGGNGTLPPLSGPRGSS